MIAIHKKVFHQLLLYLILVIGLTGCDAFSGIPKPPLSVLFAVENAGSRISFKFDISKTDFYAIKLRYFCDKNLRDDVWKNIGGPVEDKSGKRVEPGAPIIIRIRLVQESSTTDSGLIDKEFAAPKLHSWGDCEFDARLTYLKLAPGRYTLTAESLKDAPGLKEIRTELQITKAYLGK
ncbi:MAG: DUF5625 family protein [Desulfobacterales bacterium]|jgi:hypothetical protein|nr:DUF5625 family protein [Desulfobacterales bacterium]